MRLNARNPESVTKIQELPKVNNLWFDSFGTFRNLKVTDFSSNESSARQLFHKSLRKVSTVKLITSKQSFLVIDGYLLNPLVTRRLRS